MDDMELDGTPAKQPEDPFKGDAAVTAEKPEDPFNGDEAVAVEQTAQTEQPAQAEPVTEEVQPQPQPQPQPQAEAVAEEKPKWMKMVDLVAVVCIAAAGLLSALFMCLMSVKIMDVNYMLKDISQNVNNAAEAIGDSTSFEGLGSYVTTMFSNIYILLGMVTGIVAGLILGIMLIVKAIQKFAMKKQTTLEKTAITSCLFFFAVSVIVLGLAMSQRAIGSIKVQSEYGSATLAGLIICGILFAAYFICKIVVNYRTYLGDKTKLINGCMNLGWAVVAMIVLAVLSCAPVVVTVTESGLKATYGYGFNQLFSTAIGEMLNYGTDTKIPQEIADSLTTRFGWGALGMVIQIWFIFQTGKSLHGAMRGTVSAENTVKLGSQIWRLVFSVLYLIACVVLAKDLVKYDYEGFKTMLAAPIVILIFSIIGLALAIVNKILVKEQANKKEI